MELLVVIAIIGILASLMFPAVNGVMNAARKAAAKNDVVQIANAINMYYTEYGKLPPVSQNVDSSLVSVLIGTDTNNNPRKISFLEVSKASKGRSGTNGSGDFVDPWQGVYKLAVDSDYDNQVTGGTNGETLRKTVAVWNDPAIHTPSATAAEKKTRYVTSW